MRQTGQDRRLLSRFLNFFSNNNITNAEKKNREKLVKLPTADLFSDSSCLDNGVNNSRTKLFKDLAKSIIKLRHFLSLYYYLSRVSRVNSKYTYLCRFFTYPLDSHPLHHSCRALDSGWCLFSNKLLIHVVCKTFANCFAGG